MEKSGTKRELEKKLSDAKLSDFSIYPTTFSNYKHADFYIVKPEVGILVVTNEKFESFEFKFSVLSN